jgi:hypothetical protein
MATRLYCGRTAAPYSPATYRGAWDKTSDATSRLIWTEGYDTAQEYFTSNTTATANYDVLLYRGVSHRLAAQTISGTFNLCFAIRENNAAMNGYFHVHIYVTQGDSDTVRGTLLSDYIEPVGSPPATEFSTSNTAAARSLEAAVTLSSVACSAGDRIVVEIGGRQQGAVASSFTPMWGAYASSSTDLAPLEDGWGTDHRTWVEFSANLTWATPIARATQATVETLREEPTASAAVTQAYADVVILSPGDPQRITQAVAEIAQAQTASLRVTQLVAELVTPTVTESRVTQIVAELLAITVIESRVTQALAEVANAGIGETRVSQFVIEMLGRTTTYCGPPSISPAPLCGKPDVLAWMEWTVPMREN